jgi:lipopolysaccharide export system permease protein
MHILRNYVLKEIRSNFWATLLILTFVLLAGNVFTKMMDLVLNRGVDPLAILQIVVYSTPFMCVYTLPMAMLVSVLLAFGRLSADHELTAVRASGISLARIVRPVVLAAAVLSCFIFFLNDRIASQSHFKMRQVSTQIGLRSPAAALEEGVFIKSFGDLVIFIHRIEGNDLHQVRIYQPQPKGPTRTIVAERGQLIPIPEQNVIKLKLENGTTDEPDANNPGRFYKLKFGTYFLPLDLSGFKFKAAIEKKRKEMTVHELWSQFRKLKSEGFIDNYVLTEIHQKIAMALSPLILTLIAIPLGMRTHRSEKSVGYAVALILGTVYWVAIIGVGAISKTGTVPPVIAMHLPNAAFLLVGLALLRKMVRS